MGSSPTFGTIRKHLEELVFRVLLLSGFTELSKGILLVLFKGEKYVKLCLHWLRLCAIILITGHAEVVELADALDSKSSEVTLVWVRVPPSAPVKGHFRV